MQNSDTFSNHVQVLNIETTESGRRASIKDQRQFIHMRVLHLNFEWDGVFNGSGRGYD